MLAPPQSLHSHLRRLCWQILVPPQSLQVLLMRLCVQILAPPQSLHLLLMQLCSQMLVPPQSLHLFLWRLCSHFLRAPCGALSHCLSLSPPPLAASAPLLCLSLFPHLPPPLAPPHRRPSSRHSPHTWQAMGAVDQRKHISYLNNLRAARTPPHEQERNASEGQKLFQFFALVPQHAQDCRYVCRRLGGRYARWLESLSLTRPLAACLRQNCSRSSRLLRLSHAPWIVL